MKNNVSINAVAVILFFLAGQTLPDCLAYFPEPGIPGQSPVAETAADPSSSQTQTAPSTALPSTLSVPGPLSAATPSQTAQAGTQPASHNPAQQPPLVTQQINQAQQMYGVFSQVPYNITNFNCATYTFLAVALAQQNQQQAYTYSFQYTYMAANGIPQNSGHVVMIINLGVTPNGVTYYGIYDPKIALMMAVFTNPASNTIPVVPNSAVNYMTSQMVIGQTNQPVNVTQVTGSQIYNGAQLNGSNAANFNPTAIGATLQANGIPNLLANLPPGSLTPTYPPNVSQSNGQTTIVPFGTQTQVINLPNGIYVNPH